MIDAALKHDPSVTDGKQGTFEFHLSGEEEGTYQIIIDDEGARAVEGSEEEAQCTLKIDKDNFREMVAGKLNKTTKLNVVKLKIKSNMGIDLKLQTILNSFSF